MVIQKCLILIIWNFYLVKGLNMLVEGWLHVPHSFAIVNCFQLVHLLQTHYDLNIFTSEIDLYDIGWKSTDEYEIYSDSHQASLKTIKKWYGEPVDVVYRIHFPLNMKLYLNKTVNVPHIIFFAATWGVFSMEEILIHEPQWDLSSIRQTLRHLPRQLTFVTPSPGSANAMKLLLTKEHAASNLRVIPHGVDLSYFYQQFDPVRRDEVRQKFGVQHDDFLFLNVGAMVTTKGIDTLLLSINYMANTFNSTYTFKLLLKGMDNVYSSHGRVVDRLKFLKDENVISDEQFENIFKIVIFTGETLSFSDLNDLYNAADAYLSPYLCEAFNLPIIEAIATGLPVFVSENGSTSFFVDHILQEVPGASRRIFKIPTSLYVFHSFNYHSLHPDILVDTIMDNLQYLKRPIGKYYYHSLSSFLMKHYSWFSVADKLYDLILEVTQPRSMSWDL